MLSEGTGGQMSEQMFNVKGNHSTPGSFFPDAKHTIGNKNISLTLSHVSPPPHLGLSPSPFPPTPPSSSPTSSPSRREAENKVSVLVLGGKEEGEGHLRWKEQVWQMHRGRDVLCMLSPGQEGYAGRGNGADGGRAGAGARKGPCSLGRTTDWTLIQNAA